jgi:anti-sigma regulatory factor (Ser/Thr protein kinase)/anti-anti-sigma regulatory factor
VPATGHDNDEAGHGGAVVRDAERGNPAGSGNVAGRGIAAELQEALLPTALPVLPQVRIAARYLVAGQEQAAGGDWFDAIPLDGGAVALVVGDVVGHGVAASAAMGQLRAVLAELLAAEDDLGNVLRRADAFAARMPSLRAATLALVVLDPAAGTLRYTTCGHPPPLVISLDGKARYLKGTGTGPLGTGSPPVLASNALAPGELILLYSDGLVERPDRTIAEGMAELAVVTADAAAGRSPAPDPATADPPAPDQAAADQAAAERVCQLSVELLTRAGHSDDVTALTAQWLADPVPPLHLSLPSARSSLTTARDAFVGWLRRLDATADDWEALHLAMVEVFTNAIEHAYPREAPGTIELDASLESDGSVACLVTDHGTWRPPDPADADRGHGLMVAGHVVDELLVSHPAADDAAGPGGTTVTMRLRLRRPAVLASGHRAEHVAYPAERPFTVDTSVAAGATARALVGGTVDITTADLLARRLLSVSRGGTVPLVADLTGVTQLASAAVRALYEVSEQLAAHGQRLVLVTVPGSAAHMVLDLARLDHVTREESA